MPAEHRHILEKAGAFRLLLPLPACSLFVFTVLSIFVFVVVTAVVIAVAIVVAIVVLPVLLLLLFIFRTIFLLFLTHQIHLRVFIFSYAVQNMHRHLAIFSCCGPIAVSVMEIT